MSTSVLIKLGASPKRQEEGKCQTNIQVYTSYVWSEFVFVKDLLGLLFKSFLIFIIFITHADSKCSLKEYFSNKYKMYYTV